ncbi:hypothetical protein D3C85_757180 [compost metagenome]
MHDAAIRTHHAILDVHVIQLVLAQVCQDAVGVVRSRGLDRAQVLQRHGVVGRLQRRRHGLAAFKELLAPGAARIRCVPVPAIGQVHALRGRQAHGVDVVDEHDHARQPHRLGHAEFVGGLDGVGGVGAGVRQGKNLCLAGLCLQQERREIVGRQGMLDRAHDLAAARLDHLRRIGLQRMPECVVCRQEVPAFAARLDHRRARAARQRNGVVGIVQGVGRALLVGQRGGTRAHHDDGFLLVRRHLGHGQRGAGIGAADQHVQAALVKPFARLGRCDIRLVLVICRQQFDLLAVDLAAHFLDGHFDGFHPARAVGAGVHAGQVGDEPDSNDIVRDLGVRGAGADQRHSGSAGERAAGLDAWH